MAKQKEKINWKKEARLLPGYLIVTVWVLFTAVMLFWIFGASLSTSREIFSGKVFEFASGFHWENYVTAWKAQNVSRFFANSLLYATVSCVGVLLIAAPCAYVLSRWNFKGSRTIRLGLLISMSVPAIMIIMPIYSLAVQWGIKGRILLIVLYIMLRVPYTGWILPSEMSFSRVRRATSRLTGSNVEIVIASGVSSIMRSTPVRVSIERIFLPSRPMILPFISSFGRSTTDTVASATLSAAQR